MMSKMNLNWLLCCRCTWTSRATLCILFDQRCIFPENEWFFFFFARSMLADDLRLSSDEDDTQRVGDSASFAAPRKLDHGMLLTICLLLVHSSISVNI